MAPVATDTGWQPLRKGTGTGGGRSGRFGRSPFSRLAIVHMLSAAGDTFVTLALAGSLFFSISPQAARGRVALYLVLTMAPFAVVAPFLGPVLDRRRSGRRWMLVLASAGRALVCLSMAGHLLGLWLFPEAFLVLVLSKAHLVTKSALVPTTVADEQELVTANARLAVLAVLAGFAAAAVGVPVLKIGVLGGPWVVRLGALTFAAAAVASVRVKRPPESPGPEPTEAKEELQVPSVRMAAVAMSVLRAIVGFLTFLVAFAFRADGSPAWWFGAVLVASLGGTLVGNLIAPRLRRVLTEERMLLGSLALVSLAAVLGGRASGLTAFCVAALATGIAAGAGKLAFDSIVQRDAPDAVRGRTFARFETRFQLVWVAGAFVPVVLHISPGLGIGVIALAAALTFFVYVGGLVAATRRGRHFSSGESRVGGEEG
jgi:hypothetical protein